MRDFGRIQNFQSKLAQTCFYITGCRRFAAGINLSPVSLHLDQFFLLTELLRCIADTFVSVRMVLHRMSHNVGNLVVASVVELFHRVADTTLYGLEAVVNRRNST